MTPETPEIWRKKLISYEAELGATAEPAMQARLQHAMGRLLEDRLDEPREALVHYQEAAAADPAYRPALRDARRLFRSSDQPLMAAEILHRESRCVPDAVTRAALHWERGQLLEQAGADTTVIRAAHEAALAADPTCVPALHALGPILAASADWQALSDAYGEAAGASEDPTTRAGLLCEQARVTELHLEGAEVACDMYSVAVDADPTHLVALVELERLARRCARWSLLAQTLERTAALSGAGTDAAHDLDEAAGIHLRQLGDEAAAHRCLLLALAADSEHVPSLDGAEGLLRGHASYQSLADLRGRQAEAAVGAAEKAAFLCRQADLLARLPDRSEEALTVYRRAAALSPTYLPALKELGRRLEETGEWQELVDLQLAEAAALEDPSARGERWMRAAELLERKLGLEDRAIEVLQRATGSGPGRLRAVRELVRLLGRAGRWEEAAGALVTEVESSDEPEHRVEHLRRLAEIRESHLEDRVEAVRALHELLEDRPEDLAARSELGRLLRDLEWWEELAESRLQEAELLDDARGIVALLQESDASVVADIEQEVAQVVEVLSAATRRSDDSVVPATPHRRAQAER